MPLVYQQNINGYARIGLWHIAEPETFFLEQVPVQRTITHPHKRLQHLAGRLLLKELYPDFPYELIRVADTKKPFLENEAYHFSISHSGNYAAAVASNSHRVGVDVELISSKVEKVKHKFLTEAEQWLLRQVSAHPGVMISEQLLTAAWSIKESLFKWQGSSDVDFKKHLQLMDIRVVGNGGIASCRITRQHPVDLEVHFLFFSDSCLSWVLSDVF